VGSLFLYTLLQSSPSFAESLVVRSDLDTLVMPLLRTLYFASRSHTFLAKDYASKRSSVTSTSSQAFSSDIRGCPFRSQSQLYVIIILLLLFSQDSSFGRDAFKRITVNNVVWYKERHLKNINLGSIILLTVLRSLLFNLNRLHDVFMLRNCCAVLMNLSSSVVGLHEYAAMRLASITVTIMKKHSKLVTSTPPLDKESKESRASNLEEEELSSPLAMHAEVAHTLLAIIKHSLSPKNIEGNLHLIYALVYHQMDLIKLCRDSTLYSSKETERIQNVTLKASSLIQEEGARTAPKSLRLLESKMNTLVTEANTSDSKHSLKRRKNSAVSSGDDDYTFTYEEEADPEIFFVPYVWEVIVCCTTSNSISWEKDEIRAFALLEEVEEIDTENNLNEWGVSTANRAGDFGVNGDDLV
jgi:hypothetical protein